MVQTSGDAGRLSLILLVAIACEGEGRVASPVFCFFSAFVPIRVVKRSPLDVEMASSPNDSDPNSQPGDDDPNPNISPQEELDFSILFDYDYSQPVAGL